MSSAPRRIAQRGKSRKGSRVLTVEAKIPAKGPRSRRAGRASRRGATISGGFHKTIDRTLAGQEDVEYTTHRYETTSAFTATAGAASFLLHKGNSIYRPYSGNTDSVGGYARMYTQYRKSLVISSRIEVRLWSGLTGVSEPFRIVVFPCSVAQSAIYTAYSNIAQLRDVPHVNEVLFSPGGKLPIVSASGTTPTVLDGVSKNMEDAESTVGKWEGTTGADPTTLWYFGVGYQNMAGTTTNNQQAQVTIEYKVKWYEPIATAVQVDVNKWGNDMYSSLQEQVAAKAAALKALAESTAETKDSVTPREQKRDVLDVKSDAKCVRVEPPSRADVVALIKAQLATTDHALPGEDDDWDSDTEYEYYKWKQDLRRVRAEAKSVRTADPSVPLQRLAVGIAAGVS